MPTQATSQNSLEPLIEANEAIKTQKLKGAKQKRDKRLVNRYLKDKLPYISEEQIEEISEEEKSRLLPFAKRKQLARIVRKAAGTFCCIPVSIAMWWTFALTVIPGQPTLPSVLTLLAGIGVSIMTIILSFHNIEKLLREIKFYLTDESGPDADA